MFFLKIYYHLCTYLASSGLSCSMWNLGCVLQDLSLWCMDSLVVVLGLQSTQASVIVVFGL